MFEVCFRASWVALHIGVIFIRSRFKSAHTGTEAEFIFAGVDQNKETGFEQSTENWLIRR